MSASRARRRIPTVRVDPRGLGLAELAGRFEEAVASPWYQPPALPDSGLRLIELSQRSDVAFDDILPMLSQDEAIAARVLAVAQSARYATRGGIASLSDALVRLGIEAVTRIFLEVSMQLRVYAVKGYPMESAQLHRHAIATAEVAAAMATRARVSAGHAFLAGLLHDAGIAACLGLVAPRRPTEKAPDPTEVWPAAVRAHEKVGERLGELWKLPAEVAAVLASHHGEDDAGRMPPLCALVALSEAVVTDAGVPAPELGAKRAVRRSASSLNLTADDFDRFRAAAHRACEPFLAASAAARAAVA